MDSSELYNMKLHQEDTICKNGGRYGICVMRVPGGWIYKDGNDNTGHTQVFVSFDNEFQEKV